MVSRNDLLRINLFVTRFQPWNIYMPSSFVVWSQIFFYSKQLAQLHKPGSFDKLDQVKNGGSRWNKKSSISTSGFLCSYGYWYVFIRSQNPKLRHNNLRFIKTLITSFRILLSPLPAKFPGFKISHFSTTRSQPHFCKNFEVSHLIRVRYHAYLEQINGNGL